MFKKTLRVATAFGVLLAGYACYVRAFAFVAVRVVPQQTVMSFAPQQSRSKRDALRLARGTFGPNHWSVAENLRIRLYNVEHGYWMYAESYKRLNGGKVIELQPFALIWRSRNGKDVKTATSDKAVIELDRPFDLAVKPGESGLHVVHARLEGEVRLRDDKGTAANLDDDLFIGPLTYIEYDEKSLQIKSETDVAIQDRDMRITGFDLLIQLRPKPLDLDVPYDQPRANGFDGAQTAYLRKKVHIVIHDVGGTGVLPGTAQPRQRQGDKTPLDLRSDGEMRLDLPRPKVAVAIGPPEPPGPTFAEFSRNVEVQRGQLDEQPDQIFCDNLRLVFVPADPLATPEAEGEPKPPPKAETEDGEDDSQGGPLTDLALRRAEATGHAVRVVSQGQGVTAVCNELIYKKLLPDAPDETYFRGDATTQLRVEKIDLVREGPDKGKIQTVTHIRAIDATIFDDGTGNEFATVVARGPGILETRPGLGQPVERTAVWQDELEMLAERGPESDPVVRKKITLTGLPKFVDVPGQTALDAVNMIVVWLKPKAPIVAKADPAPTVARNKIKDKDEKPADAPAAGGFEIEKLVALDQVHLNAPGKTMTARERLDALFQTEPAPAAVGTANADADARPAPAPDSTVKTDPAAADAAQPAGPAKPNVIVTANRVWAEVLQRPGNPQAQAGALPAARGEVQKVYLRGQVAIHQDPEPGETVGTDVTGAAADMFNQGNDKSKFLVYNLIPVMNPAAASPEAEAKRAAERALASPARIVTKEMTVEGPIIGMDQSTDEAWVDGPGKLVLMTERGLLNEKGPADPNPDRPRPKNARAGAAAPVRKVPLTIAWRDEMKFFGRSVDPQGKPAARAEFFTGVRAWTEDGLLVCQDMKVYMDRRVQLAQAPKPDPKAAADEPAGTPEPKPDIALIECFENAVAIARKVDRTEPKRPVFVQQYQIEGNYLTYDKLTGDFQVPGAGTVLLWGHEGENTGRDGDKPAEAPATKPARPITRTANPVRRPADLAARTGDPTKPKAAAEPKLLVQTCITFSKLMKGRVHLGKETDQTEPRWAEFFGEVETIHGRVPDLKTRINPDKPPEGYASMTAQMMRLISEPPPPGSPENTPARNFLKAWDDAHANRADMDIHGDVITYDSFKDLYYAYGLDGREVSLAQQKGLGQPFTVTRGRTAFFNHKTGEAKMDEPSAVQLVDHKTGARPQVPKPSAPTPPKPTRSIRRTPGSSVERKGFGGN